MVKKMQEVFKNLTIKTLIIFLLLLGYAVISFTTGTFEKNFEISKGISEQSNSIKEDLNDEEIDDVEGYGILLKGTGLAFSTLGLMFIIIIVFSMQFITLFIFFIVFLKNLISFLLIKGNLKKWKLNICRVLWILGIIEIVLLLGMFIILFPFIKVIPYIGIMIIVLIFVLYYNIKSVIKSGLFNKIEKT